MGIRFLCQHCGFKLNVKQSLAGKRGICPSCQGKIEIPADESTGAAVTGGAMQPDSAEAGSSSSTAGETATSADDASLTPEAGIFAEPLAEVAPAVIAPTAVAMADPIAENPALQWYVGVAGSSTPYGPAKGDVFRGWIIEGRVAPDSLVWREDWTDWRRADEVLPQMQPLTLPPHAPMASSQPVPVVPTWSNAAPLAAPVPATASNPPTLRQPAAVPSSQQLKSPPVALIALAVVVLLLIPLLIWVIRR